MRGVASSSRRRLAFWLACVAIALSPLLALVNCTSYVLGPTDTGALRDSVELEGRAYKESDSGRVRAYARGALGVLKRSGVTLDASVVACEVAK